MQSQMDDTYGHEVPPSNFLQWHVLSRLSTNNNATEPIEPQEPDLDTELLQQQQQRSVDYVGETGSPLLEVSVRESVSDYSLVLRSIREVISCCACFSSDYTMKECANGHLLCHTCFLTLRQDEHPQCPTCRANLYPDTRRALIAQKVLSELPDKCPACNTSMLHKDLTGHRLNECPKRRVACGLAPLGCQWCGRADEYRVHYADCKVKKDLAERPIDENLDGVLSKFRKREQALCETFKSFSTVLRHLEGHELQTLTVALSLVRATSGKAIFRSDQFHANQSRWTLEISIAFEDALENVSLEITDSDGQPTASTPEVVNLSDQVNTSHAPLEEDTNLVQSEARPPSVRERLSSISLRQRRALRLGAARHRPYPEWYRPRPMHSENANASNVLESVTRINDLQPIYDPPRPQSRFGELTYSIIKENSPGVSRRAYGFILLNLDSQETGAHVNFRPISTAQRFVSRGEKAGPFSAHPMRWRYLTGLGELKDCRLIQAELGIARRLLDDSQGEQF